MGKKNRCFTILNLIESKEVQSQQDLLDKLEKDNIHVTQSTLSKDLKELGIIKVRGKDGKFRFVQTKERDTYHTRVMLKKELLDYMRHMDVVNNLILLKTVPGNASGLSKCLDDMEWEEIAGTLASVDTVLGIALSPADAKKVMNKLQDIMDSK
jgi:transcriptional regulator of arginine metabolism